MARRPQTIGEEIANSTTHGLALIASVAVLPFLVLGAMRGGDGWQIASVIVFGITLIMLYAASTLYHAWKPGEFKRALRVVDHSAIYLLIAGTYTPFMVGALRGAWGWTLLAVIWSLAALGVIAKCALGVRFPRLSTALYVAMGWLVVIAARPLMHNVAPAGLGWLLAGGLCYTGGVVFYATDARIRYGHALWHVFVAAGSTCHVIAVLWYAGHHG
ncbi:MAG: hemolysin family protein [Gemmatimonadetes bacterium]|nr:hemolysin family protein [Gemmatimonadota bacterium]